MFKIAVIGCGNIAARVHGPSHALYRLNNKDVILAACCDTDIKKAETFVSDFGYERSYSRWEYMLEEIKPDAVCLYLPPRVTSAIACKVLALGYPLLLEKPPGINVKEAMDIKAVAEKCCVPYMVALNRRFAPLVVECVDYMDEQGIVPTTIEFFMVRNNRMDPDFSTTAIHGIDLLAFLSKGRYEKASINYQKVVLEGGVASNIFIDAKIDNGIHTRLSFINASGSVLERVTIHAPHHTIMLNLPMWHGYDAPGSMLHIEDGEEKTVVLGKMDDMHITNGFYGENELFFDSIINKKELTTNIDECIGSMRLAESISNGESEIFFFDDTL